MAKSDFDLDDEEYNVVSEDSGKKSFFPRAKKDMKKKDESLNMSAVDIAMIDNLNSNVQNDTVSTDLGDFSNVENNFSSNIVFEDNNNMTLKEKIKDYISTINVRAFIVFFGIFLIVFVIAFMVILNVVKSNRAYVADAIVPNIVYMGETSNIYVNAKYNSNNQPKKNINNTETTFNVGNSKVLYILNNSLKGSSVINTIVPVQEGRTTLDVTSKLDERVIGKLKKSIVVCPAFTNSLVLVKHISLTKGTTYKLNIDFGEDECAKGVTYSSSNESVATVDEEGLITGVGIGKSILTIAKGSKSISLIIDVTNKYVSLKSFKVIPTDLQLSKGEKYRLKVDYEPVEATNFSVKFYSNDESIIKVSEGGLVEALSSGTTTIKVITPIYTFNTEVSVTVTDDSGSFATNMSLDKSKIKLVQGKSEKIKVSLTPKNVNDSVVSWKSLDDEIASVTSDGIIFAKNIGTTTITAYTDNGISREVKVTVVKMKTPVVTSSDAIESDDWHTRPYILSFSGADNGAVYYYGNSIDQMDKIANKLTISSDENKTYYIKACNRICSETCTNKKNKNGRVMKDSNGDPIKVCSSKCSKSPSLCSDPVVYISKLDMTKPVINSVTPVRINSVQLYVIDNTSLVQKWCVTTKNSYANCKWKSIQTSSKPLIEYVALKNGIYYAFAKDVAGNMSNSYKFEITTMYE